MALRGDQCHMIENTCVTSPLSKQSLERVTLAFDLVAVEIVDVDYVSPNFPTVER